MNGEQRKTGVIKGFLYAPSIFLDIPRLNILLFVATFFTTYYINGPAYAICIITILQQKAGYLALVYLKK